MLGSLLRDGYTGAISFTEKETVARRGRISDTRWTDGILKELSLMAGGEDDMMKNKEGTGGGALFHTKIKSKDVTIWEMVFGYFLGPLGVLVMTTLVSTYYLTYYRTYDDIVARGSFLALLPPDLHYPYGSGKYHCRCIDWKDKNPGGQGKTVYTGSGSASPCLRYSDILHSLPESWVTDGVDGSDV